MVRKMNLAQIAALLSVLTCSQVSAQGLGFELLDDQFRFAANSFGFKAQMANNKNRIWDSVLPTPFGPTTDIPPITFTLGGDASVNGCAVSGNNASCLETDNEECFTLQGTTVSSAMNLTGMRFDDTVMPQCLSTGNELIKGLSFLSTDVDPNGTFAQGIALYTLTGPNPGNPNDLAFMQPNAPGNLAEGQYFTFNLDNPLGDSSTPHFLAFGDLTNCDASSDTFPSCASEHYLQVLSEHVIRLSQNNGCSQTQQKMGFQLRNSNDPTPNDDPGEIEYSPYVFCDGINCEVNLARVFSDPAQASKPVIGGPLAGGGGLATKASVNGSALATVWTSHGTNGTMNTTSTSVRTFEMRVSWPQLVTALRLSTTFKGLQPGSSLNGNVDSDVEVVFGVDWEDPQNWIVQQVKFGQEVSNPNYDGQAAMNGTNGCTNASQLARVGGYLKFARFRAVSPLP